MYCTDILYLLFRYLIYRHWSPKSTHEEFLKILQAAWVDRGTNEGDHDTHVQTHNHVKKNGVYTARQPRCKWCSLYYGSTFARRTWYYCEQCEVPLCKDGACFNNYHDETKRYNATNTTPQNKEARRRSLKRKRSQK